MGVPGRTGDNVEVSVKGLANVGNTCYFASAIQVSLKYTFSSKDFGII
jgi:uncharacterized UBP type Zn finger protein